MQVIQFILFALLFASQTAIAAMDINLTPGVTPVSHDIYQLHMTIFWICVAIGVVVFGVMFYSMIHHRKSKGAKAAHFHEHLWVEITWSIIPFIILILMAIPATRVLIRMNDTAQADITIKITGYQWKWRYEYLDSGINFFSNNATPFDQMQNKAPKDSNYLRAVDHPLVIPIHKKVRFLVTGNDVIHSWWVPDFGVKRDAVPGFINEAWTRVNRAGIYYGQCAELCGINHAFMPIVVIAMAEKDFDNWVAQQKGRTTTPAATTTPPASAVVPAQPAAPAAAAPATPATKTASTSAQALTQEELMKHGEQVYLQTCSVCHQPNGEGMPPTFPSLKNSAVTTGPAAEHIKIVLNGKSGTAMQPFRDQLNDADIAAVLTYERNSWGHKAGIVKPEDVTAAKK